MQKYQKNNFLTFLSTESVRAPSITKFTTALLTTLSGSGSVLFSVLHHVLMPPPTQHRLAIYRLLKYDANPGQNICVIY